MSLSYLMGTSRPSRFTSINQRLQQLLSFWVLMQQGKATAHWIRQILCKKRDESLPLSKLRYPINIKWSCVEHHQNDLVVELSEHDPQAKLMECTLKDIFAMDSSGNAAASACAA